MPKIESKDFEALAAKSPARTAKSVIEQAMGVWYRGKPTKAERGAQALRLENGLTLTFRTDDVMGYRRNDDDEFVYVQLSRGAGMMLSSQMAIASDSAPCDCDGNVAARDDLPPEVEGVDLSIEVIDFDKIGYCRLVLVEKKTCRVYEIDGEPVEVCTPYWTWKKQCG